MNSKWHLYISYAKSVIRIVSCIASVSFSSLYVLAAGFFLAELLGIIEEVGDKR